MKLKLFSVVFILWQGFAYANLYTWVIDNDVFQCEIGLIKNGPNNTRFTGDVDEECVLLNQRISDIRGHIQYINKKGITLIKHHPDWSAPEDGIYLTFNGGFPDIHCTFKKNHLVWQQRGNDWLPNHISGDLSCTIVCDNDLCQYDFSILAKEYKKTMDDIL